ncbi:LysR family transcriptional regulator [Aliivibrio sifiae]|uniref:HTH lysR-type domain-containing protein n=1 Tax=Aliivibrio sifiae TaxID=566293 RepID=A0A2S7XCA3_9GAMM|nr:LysR family transcriptional regulator [Aliivibrio sifiae]PQJ88980.1 hypothetical protein BTO22_05010 [Aliivibrio sifiae]
MYKNVDLNLLRTLILIHEHKSLKLVSRKLGKSESAVSKQLTKLREQLGDILFERSHASLEPTHYTLTVIPQIKVLLESIDNVLEIKSFDPLNYTAEINIAIPSVLNGKDGAEIYQKIKASFPNAYLRVINWDSSTIEKLALGEVTLGMHYWNDDRASDVYQQHIMTDTMVIAIAKGYSNHWESVKNKPFIKLISHGWNDQRFRYIEHIRKQGIKLNFDYEVDNINLAKELLLNNDIAWILPSRLLSDDLEIVDMPEQMKLDLHLATSVRLSDRSNPLHRELLSIIRSIFINELH